MTSEQAISGALGWAEAAEADFAPLLDGLDAIRTARTLEQLEAAVRGQKAELPRNSLLVRLIEAAAHQRRRQLHQSQGLTPRERDCLGLVAAGLTDGVIAGRLGLTNTTVRWHLDNARRKLGAATRAQAVAIGLQARLISI